MSIPLVGVAPPLLRVAVEGSDNPTIKKLSNDPTSPNPLCLVNSKQVAHRLLVNGLGTMPTKPKCPALPTVEGKPSLVSAFSEEEYRKGIAALKNNKAAGIDDIVVEQLKNLGPKAHKWLHTMLSTCFIDNKIPKIWRQSKIIAILKPGKDSAIPKNYRPISLLCHTYKLYERLILNRVPPLLEQHLINEQAGFRPGKSCTSQLLNLTQHIEDGYQRGMITGAAFVDLSAAYDTVNHRILMQKLYNTTQDNQLYTIFQNILSNRRFYVELNNERSRWRKQKNGLPQGSVLSPILFNIYTNDQPIHEGTRNFIFIYADDPCVTAQYSSFTEASRIWKLRSIQHREKKPLLTVKSSVQSKCLNFVSLNIRSLKNKTTSLFDYIVSQNIDVLALTETWLCCGDNAVLNDLLPPGYDIRHVDRERRGGGVALIYKKIHFISKYSTHT